MKVVVVGSGLAAAGAIRALLKRGVKPVVLDLGRTLPNREFDLKSKLAIKDPCKWTHHERRMAYDNAKSNGRVVPRKLVLGSDYFYSSDMPKFSTEGSFTAGSPPWSPALGGFSVGWGGAVLPPSPDDLSDWPITHTELMGWISDVLDGIQVSEPKDPISFYFGRLRSTEGQVLQLSAGQSQLLDRLNTSASQTLTSTYLVGQSRLLTCADSNSRFSCRYCGECSSGCVYDAIYTAESDFLRWLNEDAIDYRPGSTVFRISEDQNSAKVSFLRNDSIHTIEADRILVASGATNSTRLLLNSSPNGLRSARIKRTGGTLQLFATAKPLEVSWPKQNTQTSHFVEIQCKEISLKWSHVQVGQPNELLLRRLGVSSEQNRTVHNILARRIARHIVSTMLNVSSAFGPHYDIKIERNNDGLPNTATSQSWSQHGRESLKSYERQLNKFMKAHGFYRLPFARQDSSSAQGYHFGSSFPMSSRPTSDFETDVLGRPFGWRHIHVIDTTVLPEIPGTTIGLLTMANAFRIASQS